MPGELWTLVTSLIISRQWRHIYMAALTSALKWSCDVRELSAVETRRERWSCLFIRSFRATGLGFPCCGPQASATSFTSHLIPLVAVELYRFSSYIWQTRNRFLRQHLWGTVGLITLHKTQLVWVIKHKNESGQDYELFLRTDYCNIKISAMRQTKQRDLSQPCTCLYNNQFSAVETPLDNIPANMAAYSIFWGKPTSAITILYVNCNGIF